MTPDFWIGFWRGVSLGLLAGALLGGLAIGAVIMAFARSKQQDVRRWAAHDEGGHEPSIRKYW